MADQITGQTRLVGVIGDPVRHSMSPALLNAAFRAAGLDYRVLAMPVNHGDAAAAVAGMRSLGIEGCSVTMPHKADVIAHLDDCSKTATTLNAVNCIRRDGKKLIGENTDGSGFLRGLADDTGLDPEGKQCVVIGAGGAARAVVVALARAGAAQVTVVNRSRGSAETAAALAGPIGQVGTSVVVPEADLVVQATPVGMHNDDPSAVDGSLFRPGQVLVDLVYFPSTTSTMEAAHRAGSQVTNGLSMLIHQAAVSFEHWTGVKADIEIMRAAAVAAS